MKKRINIYVANTTAKNSESYLSKLEKISKERQDGGFIHGGHIHFIQQKVFPVLKDAIKMILDNIPSKIPYDLPELVKKKDFKPTQELINVVKEINKDLVVPIQGFDIVNVILAAREYEKGD